jgi:addiction module HigA family antidote
MEKPKGYGAVSAADACLKPFKITALRKLRLLHAAKSVGNLRVPSGNRLESLKGDRKGQSSIRINDQCAFVFIGPRIKGRLAMSKSSTTTRLRNPHPGEILLEEFLRPMGISQNALARAIGVPPRRINEIVHGLRGITADTDLRFARFFGLSEGFFMALQSEYELVSRRREIAGELKTIKPRAA